ncbi:MAG: alpha/beta fold hydrolase [Calditrichaeota bacterium]|nr:alpha/beta fold hydrolase [Calditrichota bacterium]
MLKIILYIILLSAVGIIAFFIFMNYVLQRTFHHSPIKEKHTPDEAGFASKEIFVVTEHQKKIQVYDLNPADGHNLALLGVHGWANNSDTLLPLSKKLTKLGRVFLLNTRSHGKSDPETNMTILKFETDILKTVDYIKKELGNKTPVILFGHSLGGAASLLAAADDSRISGVVAISTFADMKQILQQGFLKHKIPGWFINSLLTYIEFRIGRTLQEVSPAHSIKRISKPVLLIHGTKDEVIDYSDVEKIYKKAKRENVEKFVVKGHNHSSLLNDENVAIAIETFIKKNFVKS